MTLSDARRAALEEVAAALPVVRRPLLVGMDGGDGAGKTWFADDLALVLTEAGREVVRASVDDWHHPRAFRHALGRTGETVWSRSFDLVGLRRELLDPWRSGRSVRTRWHDLASDEQVDEPRRDAPADGVLVVDGVFLQRPELLDVWDLVVWLDVPDAERVARMAARDGVPADAEHPDQRRYLDAQAIYAHSCRPRESADLVVDNGDVEAPRLISVRSGPPAAWSAPGP